MTQYSTGRPCKRGHLANRFVVNRRCVECHRLYQLAQYEKWRGGRPPAPRRKFELSWDQRHPERAKVYEQNRLAKLRTTGKLSSDIVEIRLREQNGKCVYCQTDITSCSTIDHKTPISRGGLNVDNNIQLLCGPCNSRKWTRTHEEHLERIS